MIYQLHHNVMLLHHNLTYEQGQFHDHTDISYVVITSEG